MPMVLDTSEVSRNLQRIGAGFGVTLTHAWLDRLGALIVAEAKRICPYRRGDLMRSIGWKVVGNVLIIFALMEYAMVQHENLEYHHDRGEAKYIEKPLLEVGLGEAPEVVARELVRKLGEL